MIRFDDTEIAFGDKSHRQLQRAYWLFRIVGSPFLVSLGAVLLRSALLLRVPVKWALKPTIFAHFCGGESIEECGQTVRTLEKSKISSILDYSSEGKETESDFELTKNQVIQTMEKALHDPAVPYAVFKPTGLARFGLLEKIQTGKELSELETREYERFETRLHEICNRAVNTGVPVMVDAEESWIQTVVDRIVEGLMMKYNTNKPLVFNTLQMYRVGRLEYLKNFASRAREKGVFGAFKLVRGAYMEKERDRAEKMGYKSPIYPDKQSTDNAFDEATRFCLENIDCMAVCVGTHNEVSCSRAVSTMLDLGIPAGHPNVSFAQLLGMSDHISYKLASEGFLVCKYVPYGPVRTVIPYLVRRAEENTSVAGQTPRELALIRAELKRRKAAQKTPVLATNK